MPTNRVSFKIGDVMRGLAKQEQVPRLENSFRIAAKSLWAEYEKHGTTSLLEDSMEIFLWECKNPRNKLIRANGVDTLTSSQVLDVYMDDSEFLSNQANALQSLCFAKEAIKHHAVFGDVLSIHDELEKHLRVIDCYVPAVMNDMFCILGIPFTTHADKDKPRQNTEVLVTCRS